jgi:ribosomal protein L11 methyltransferase
MHESGNPLLPESVLSIYYIQGKIPSSQRFPDYFLGNWEEDGFSFLFFRQPVPELVDTLIRNNPDLQLLDTYAMTYEQWQGGRLAPMTIGTFHFTPPWCNEPLPEPELKRLILDPGVVFGNGTHPTTRDCLEAIDLVCGGRKVRTMLDLGTGTGILALAAVKSGCAQALAVDFNFLAAQTARNNVRLNGMEKNILVIQGRAEEHTVFPSDFLVANIHHAVMKDLIRSPGFLQQKWFLLSGLLRSEAKEVLEFLSTQPVVIVKQWNGDVWTTILGLTVGQ